MSTALLWVCFFILFFHSIDSSPLDFPALKSHSQFRSEAAVTLKDIPDGVLKNELLDLELKNETAFTMAMKEINQNSLFIYDTKYAHVGGDGMLYFTEPRYDENSYKTKRKNRIRRESSLNSTFQRVDEYNVPIHHSFPGCGNIIWLNVQGGVIQNTAWNNPYNGGLSIYHAPPYLSTTWGFGPRNFTNDERDGITLIWQRIASDYAPFKIDVTTEKPPSLNSTTGEIMFTSFMDANSNFMPGVKIVNSQIKPPGGIAWVNKFGLNGWDYYQKYQYYSPALVYEQGFEPDAEAGSHEMGHNLGLSHDKPPNDDYYKGHCSNNGITETCWGPIMGTGYNDNVTQWSKGEHPGGTQEQDDLEIISNKIGYRDDDAGDTFDTAVTIFPENNNGFKNGIIERTSDTDMYKLNLPTLVLLINATISIKIHGFTKSISSSLESYGVNLNTKLIIYNESKDTICTDNKLLIQESTCTFIGDNSSFFYISVQGVGDESQITKMFHNVNTAGYTLFPAYGSLGDYRIVFDLNTMAAPSTSPAPFTSPAPNEIPSDDNTLSTGAIAGIAGAAILLIIALLLLCHTSKLPLSEDMKNLL